MNSSVEKLPLLFKSYKDYSFELFRYLNNFIES